MIKLSLLFLLLTIPFLGGQPILGLPLWVWGSLAATLLYALLLIVLIERRWDDLKESDNG